MPFKLLVDGRAHEIDIIRRRPHLVVSVNGREHEVSAPGMRDDGRQTIEVAGLPIQFIRAHVGDRQIIHLGGRNFETAIIDRSAETEDEGAGRDVVRAPMPGAVVAIHTSEGAEVKRGDPVVTIESMKLQMALHAPRDGVIAALPRKQGEKFDKDEVIARLEPLGERG
jgi:3-methylcrotonyl-CoA carboxylase alpha subunit